MSSAVNIAFKLTVAVYFSLKSACLHTRSRCEWHQHKRGVGRSWCPMHLTAQKNDTVKMDSLSYSMCYWKQNTQFHNIMMGSLMVTIVTFMQLTKLFFPFHSVFIYRGPVKWCTKEFRVLHKSSVVVCDGQTVEVLRCEIRFLLVSVSCLLS